jgi:ATP-binding cassette, subfamily B, bacterial MsbA
MRKYSLVFAYLKDYKLSLFAYIICTILSILFGVASLFMMFPFLEVLFLGKQKDTPLNETLKSSFFGGIKQKVTDWVNTGEKLEVLTTVCLLIITCIILKNL